MALEIDPTQAQAMPVLVDVREPDEWAAGHAPGAIHVPLSAFDAALIPAGGPVAVICKAGGRSARACAFLTEQGVEAHNVVGGMMAWQAAGLPVVAESGAIGDVL